MVKTRFKCFLVILMLVLSGCFSDQKDLQKYRLSGQELQDLTKGLALSLPDKIDSLHIRLLGPNTGHKIFLRVEMDKQHASRIKRPSWVTPDRKLDNNKIMKARGTLEIGAKYLLQEGVNVNPWFDAYPLKESDEVFYQESQDANSPSILQYVYLSRISNGKVILFLGLYLPVNKISSPVLSIMKAKGMEWRAPASQSDPYYTRVWP